jgi:hypothetical protein
MRDIFSKAIVKKPRELPRCGTGGLHGEQQFCFSLGYKEGKAATRLAIRDALKKLSVDECKTIVESLRYYQTNFPSLEGVDNLCERINCGDVYTNL